MAPLWVVLGLIAAAAANPQGYNYEAPKCKLEYAKTVTETSYKTNLETKYSTRVVPQYQTKYETRIKVVPSYVYRTVVQTEYVPQTLVQTSTSVYQRNQVVTSSVKLPDQYVTRNVYSTVTKFVTRVQERQVLVTKYQPTNVYREVVRTEYVRSTVQVPRYVTTTVTQKEVGPASTGYKTEYATSTYIATKVLPAQTIYQTKTKTKVTCPRDRFTCINLMWSVICTGCMERACSLFYIKLHQQYS